MSDDLPASTGNPQTTGAVSANKEVVNMPFAGPEMPSPKEAGREADLSPEVTDAGVSMHPTTIPLPEPVARMGVQPAGANIPMPTSTPDMPITDDQIAEGLGKTIKESFRWLAEWCIRRLKQVHVGLQSVRGKLTRVTTHA